MGKLIGLLSIIFIVLLSGLVLAQNSCLDSAKNNNSILFFFYGDGCLHCADAEPFLEELKLKYNLNIVSHEVWNNDSNQKIFEEFLVAYDVPKNSWAVPGFFMGSRHVIGFDNKDSIGKNIEEMVSQCLSNNCGQKSNILRFSIFGKNIEISKDTPMFALGMVLGLADGFNPCTFAILIFLMSYLFTISASKKKILKLGLVFSFVIFLVYIAIMFGLINILSFVGFRSTGKIIIAVVLIVMGLINVKDFFWKGKGPSLEIPKFAKPILEKYIQRATVPAVIVLALILSFVELLCTIGLPLAYVSIMVDKGITGAASFFYIFWYNFFYVLPLVVIVFLTYFFVLETEKAEHYRLKLRRYMKVIGGLLMLGLAVLMLLGKL
ncbi:MAG: hypothetical protein ABH840_00605 [Nanoarchaeota archaeon]